jgi:FkbM family methyltransferase
MDILKSLIQKIFRIAGLKITRFEPFSEPLMPFDVMDYLIRQTVLDSDNFYFVQVGAHDGVRNDGLNPLITKYNLKGCLIEPMPEFFAMLTENYKDKDGLTFVNAMIGAENGTGILYRFKPNAPVPMQFYHGLAREDSNYIKNRAKREGLSNHIEAIQCKKITFQTLLKEIPYEKVDLLYIDTEGSDDKIINLALNSGIKPKIIQYEWTELSKRQRFELKMILLDHGYRFIDCGPDTIALRVFNE